MVEDANAAGHFALAVDLRRALRAGGNERQGVKAVTRFPSKSRFLHARIDALTYIALAGAAAIFALLGYKPDGRPPEPPPA